MKLFHILKNSIEIWYEKRKLNKAIYKLEAYITEQEAVVEELEIACAEDLYVQSDGLYDVALKEIANEEQKMKIYIRQKIAEYLEQPSIAEEILSGRESFFLMD